MEQAQLTKKPIGVTASAVLALLGSFLMLGICVISALTFSLAPMRQPMPPETRLGLAIALGLFAILGIWGTTTAIGLLRLRNWGRISILVFSVLLAFTGLLAGPAILLIPPPPTVAPNYDSIRKVIAALYGALGLLGLCWLYYFSRRATRDVFGGTAAVESGGRPLSISIIGWWFLIAGVISVLLSPLRMPTTLFLWVQTGWAAAAFYAVFGSLYAYSGYGLLRLNPTVRLVAVALVCFGLVNGAVFFGFPGGDTRMATLMSHSRFGAQTPPPPHFMQLVLVFSMLGVAVPLWFLIRTGKAFHPQPSPC